MTTDQSASDGIVICRQRFGLSRGDPAWGYRLAAGYLRLRGWQVNDKRVYRLWRLNGLCLPPYRPRRKIRSGARLEGLALRRNDVWAWDFVHDRYHDAEPLRCLTVKDEVTGYCLAIKTGRHLQHQHVRGYCHVNYPGRRELVNAFPSGTRHLLVHVKCFGSE